MKKKEITLEYIAESIDGIRSDIQILRVDMQEVKADIKVLKEDAEVLKVDVRVLKKDVSKIQEDVILIKLDTSQLRKDVDRHYHEFLDTQDDVQKILEIAKGGDDRLGFWQIATAR